MITLHSVGDIHAQSTLAEAEALLAEAEAARAEVAAMRPKTEQLAAAAQAIVDGQVAAFTLRPTEELADRAAALWAISEKLDEVSGMIEDQLLACLGWAITEPPSNLRSTNA